MPEENQVIDNSRISEVQERNKKSKVRFLLIGFLAIIAIAVGLYIGYKKLNNDPVGIYKDSINSVYKALNNALKENKDKSINNIDLTKDPVAVNLNAKLESSIPELKNFSGLNYNINAGLDLANKKINVGLGIKENNNSLISLILSIIDKNIYLKSPEIFNKVIDLGEEDIFGNINLDSYLKLNGNSIKYDYENYNYILKEIKNIIINSLDKNKFKIENNTITIKDKEYKGKKVSYNLDQENIERTIKFIQEQILKDEKLIKALSETIGVEINELKESLKKEPNMSGYNNSIINLYTDKLNNVIAGSFIINEGEIIKFDSIKDETNISIKNNNQVLKVLIESNDNVVITYNENEVQIFKIIFEGNDHEFKMPFMFNISGTIINGTIELKNIKTTANSASADILFKFDTEVLGKKLDLSLEGDYSVSKTDVQTLDSAGSVKIDNISEEEAMEMMNKLNDIISKLGLGDIAGSLM